MHHIGRYSITIHTRYYTCDTQTAEVIHSALINLSHTFVIARFHSVGLNQMRRHD